MDEVLKRDQNFVTVLAGVTDDSDEDITMLRVDPITKRLLVKATGIASGDVVGPATSTDNAIVRFDGTTGKLIQNSGITIDDTNHIIAVIGAMGTPSYTFSGDTDTGIYHPAANQVAIAAAGAQVLKVSSFAGGTVTSAVFFDTTATIPPNAGGYKIGGFTIMRVNSSGDEGLQFDVTSFGFGAGGASTLTGDGSDGVGNTFIGYAAGGLTNADLANHNTFVGAHSNETALPGDDNTFLGIYTGQHNTGSKNTIVGSIAGFTNLTSGSSNLLLGYLADTSTGSRSNSIVLNSSGVAFTSTADKEVFISFANKVTLNNTANILSVLDFSGVITSTKTFTFPNTSGTIALVAGGGLPWSIVTVNANFTVNTGVLANKGTLLTMTLPTTAAVGDVIRIAGMNAGLWKIAQNAAGIIHFGNQNTTTGTGGSLASTLTYDAVELVCSVANNEWVVISSIGNITIT